MRSATVALVDRATRRYGDIIAADGVSFTLEPGETVALLGPNGAGKTTTVAMLLGLMGPDAGTVLLFGSCPHAAVRAGRVGAMLQETGLPPGATVVELVSTIAGLYPQPLPVADALRLVDLEHVAGRQIQRLSGGQQQRVRLALALAGNPDLLVLDEPTASLDVEARHAFWAHVGDSVGEGRALLFATHRLEEADAVADRVIVLVGGRVAAIGTPSDVKAQVAGRAAVSLEDAFLDLTRPEDS